MFLMKLDFSQPAPRVESLDPQALQALLDAMWQGFRRMATSIASEVAKQGGMSEDVVVAVMEQMAEEGCLGLDANGQLVTMDV